MTTAPAPFKIRLVTLVVACLVSLTLGLAGAVSWRWFSILVMDVPADFASNRNPALVLNTVLPALGNSLGYFLAYRRPSRRSDLLFVGPAVLLAGVAVTVSLSQLTAPAEFRAVTVATVAALITPTVTLAVLLTGKRFLPNALRHAHP